MDIFEPLSREEIRAIKWSHLNTSVEKGETFYTPMDLCETLFVLQSGRVRIYRAIPGGHEFTVAVGCGSPLVGGKPPRRPVKLRGGDVPLETSLLRQLQCEVERQCQFAMIARFHIVWMLVKEGGRWKLDHQLSGQRVD